MMVVLVEEEVVAGPVGFDGQQEEGMGQAVGARR